MSPPPERRQPAAGARRTAPAAADAPTTNAGGALRRVGILLSPLGVRGRERMMIALAERLLAEGHAVDVLMPGPTPDWAARLPAGTRLVDLARGWSRLPGARGHSKRRVYLSVPALARYLRRERPEVLLAGSIPPNIAALLARRLARAPVPVVLRQSNVVHLPGDGRYAGVRRRPRDRLVRWLYPGAEAVIAVSDGVADNLGRLGGLPAERIRVVYNRGLPEDLEARAREPVEHPWFAGDGPPVVLNVGRLVAKKDQKTLLRAFARVLAARPARLVILGREGPERRALEALAGELGIAHAVDMPGFAVNPFAYMARAGVFVLSSVSEGMPNALVEALACGCPVASTDCPSGPSEILDGGRYGRLVPVGDADALAEAIVAALEEPGDPGARRARAADFSLDRAVAGYRDVLLAVAGAGAAAGEIRAAGASAPSRTPS